MFNLIYNYYYYNYYYNVFYLHFYDFLLDVDYIESEPWLLSFPQLSSFISVDYKTVEESYSPFDDLKDYASDLLEAIGHSEEEADEIGLQLGQLAVDIYNATDMDQLNAPHSYMGYEVYSRDQIAEILTNFDLDAYLSMMGPDYAASDRFGIFDPGQLAGLNDLFVEDNLNALKAWELCIVAETYGDFMYNGYEGLSTYSRLLIGTPEEQACDNVIQTLTDQTDIIYIENYYTEEMDQELRSLCDDIIDEYRILIGDAEYGAGLLLCHATVPQKFSKTGFILTQDLHRSNRKTQKTAAGRFFPPAAVCFSSCLMRYSVLLQCPIQCGNKLRKAVRCENAKGDQSL